MRCDKEKLEANLGLTTHIFNPLEFQGKKMLDLIIHIAQYI